MSQKPETVQILRSHNTQHLYTNTNKDITLELYLLESNMVHYGLQTIHYTVEKGLADFWNPMKQIWP